MPESPGPPVRRFVTAVLIAGLLWVGADFVYSRFVAARLARFEAAHERDARGVLVGHEAYTLGDGETAILLVHGIGDSPRGFSDLARRLAETGFTCRAMRLPGFAEPVEVGARVTRSDWKQAVGAELRALGARHGRVVLVGHSLGGTVAIATLLERLGEADALVLLTPLLDVSARRSPLVPARAWHELSKRLLVFTTTTETPFPPDIRDPSRRGTRSPLPFTPIRLFDELFALVDEMRGEAPGVMLPLMTVVSPHDRVADPGAARRFHADASSAIKELRTATDAGHVVMRDAGRERLADDIAAFARSLPGSSER